MSRAKFSVGEPVEMLCDHVAAGRRVLGWLAGRVAEADRRMVAVQFDTDVFASTGWPIPDRVLWCAHGSRHIRRLGEAAPAQEAADEQPK